MPRTSRTATRPAPSTSSKWHLHNLSPLILFLAVVSVYATSLRNDFIYDDVEIILAHPAPQSASGWARIFAERHFPNLPYYRPVTRLTLLAQKRLHGDVAWPFHLFNVLLMGLAALLAYKILRLPAFGVARGPAIFGAALFTLHPAASSCVYPISSGRETLLPAVWMLGAVFAFLSGRRPLAMLAFAGALFSKEQAVVTPALFILADVLGLSADPPGRSPAEWARRYWPVLPVAAVFFAVRYALFGGHEYLPGSLAGPVLAFLYAIQTIFAPTVALMYEPNPPVWFSPLRMAMAFALLAAIVFFVRPHWLALRRAAWFWLGWFVLTLLPTANLLRQEVHYDERYVFLASFAVFAIAAQLLSTRSLPRHVAAVAAALVVTCAAISFHRTVFFHDDIAFSREWIRWSPDSVNAHYNLAFALAKRGDAAEAATEYAEALRIQPDYAYAQCNLANTLSTLGRLDEALTHYREALRLNPDYIEAHQNLGIALARQGHPDEAVQQFREVLRLDPGSAAAHNDIGNAFAAQGRYSDAALEYSETLRLNPNLADAHNNLGNALAAQDNLTAAVDEYRKALRIRPEYEEARRNLAIVEEHLRRK